MRVGKLYTLVLHETGWEFPDGEDEFGDDCNISIAKGSNFILLEFKREKWYLGLFGEEKWWICTSNPQRVFKEVSGE